MHGVVDMDKILDSSLSVLRDRACPFIGRHQEGEGKAARGRRLYTVLPVKTTRQEASMGEEVKACQDVKNLFLLRF